MIARVDGVADVALRADGPVLGERRRADDGGGVDTPLHPDFVSAAIALEGALAGGVDIVGGMVDAKGLDDTVFDERVEGPAIQAKI